MAANTNVPAVTRTEGIPVHFFEWSLESALAAADLGSPVALFRCTIDTALDGVHLAYSTNATSSTDTVKLSTASDLAGTTRTDILTGLNIGSSSTKEKDADLSSNAPVIPAGSWLFIETDSGSATGLAGLRLHVRGRRNIRA